LFFFLLSSESTLDRRSKVLQAEDNTKQKTLFLFLLLRRSVLSTSN